MSPRSPLTPSTSSTASSSPAAAPAPAGRARSGHAPTTGPMRAQGLRASGRRVPRTSRERRVGPLRRAPVPARRAAVDRYREPDPRRRPRRAGTSGEVGMDPPQHGGTREPGEVLEQEIDPPPSADVVRLLAAADTDSRLATYLLVAVATGARRGAMCALRWSDLDLITGTARFPRVVVIGPAGPVERPATRTKRSRRKVALHPLRSRRARRPPRRPVHLRSRGGRRLGVRRARVL